MHAVTAPVARSETGFLESPLFTRDCLLLIAFFSSGVSGLGFELVWLRALGLAFGSETLGMLAVVAGFFGGVAVGSAVFHRRVIRNRHPIAIYILAESAIAVYAALAPLWMLRLATVLPQAIGPFVGDNRSPTALSLNLVIAMMALMPATTFMGATTVAVIEAWRRRRASSENATTVAWLYACNTLGATAGIVISTYWLLPTHGIHRASLGLGAFSVAGAALAWWWGRLAGDGTGQGRRRTVPEPPLAGQSTVPLTTRRVIYVLLWVTGLAGIGIEMVGTRVIAQVLEDTVYTFANILAMYLLGTSFGAWLITTKRWDSIAADRNRRTVILLSALAWGAILTAVLLGRADTLFRSVAPSSATYSYRLAGQTAVIGMIFIPVTICMGAAFSHLLGYLASEGVGMAAACNTIGAAVAPFVFGLLLIPSVGYGVSFYAAIAMYFVAFVLAACSLERRKWPVFGASILAAATAATYSPLLLVRFGRDADVLERKIGLFGVVSVVEAASPAATRSRTLIVDQTFQMGGSPGGVEKRMGHLPILLGSPAHRVAYLGVGTGIAAGASLSDDVDRVTAVELVPEILDSLTWFAPFNRDLQHDSRAELHVSDARRFIAATSERYDTIVADLFHPSRDGTASLYTQEHFLAVRDRLREGGLFVQWLPIYQLTPRDLKTIVRAFLRVFPDADSALANYGARSAFGLIGWNVPPDSKAASVDVSRVETSLARRDGPGEVFEGVEDVLGTYMLDAEGLRRYAGAGPDNTDDNQRITFDAGSAARLVDPPDFDATLASVLPYRRLFPDRFVRISSATDLAALRSRTDPYGIAATHYLNGEMMLRRTPESTLSPDAVSELVDSYREDANFTSAAQRLLGLAVQHPAHATEIIERMWLAQPSQLEIRALRERIAADHDADAMRLAILRVLQEEDSKRRRR